MLKNVEFWVAATALQNVELSFVKFLAIYDCITSLLQWEKVDFDARRKTDEV